VRHVLTQKKVAFSAGFACEIIVANVHFQERVNFFFYFFLVEIKIKQTRGVTSEPSQVFLNVLLENLLKHI
jgi:hypothetical protein